MRRDKTGQSIDERMIHVRLVASQTRRLIADGLMIFGSN
jgi:hypothetical protein